MDITETPLSEYEQFVIEHCVEVEYLSPQIYKRTLTEEELELCKIVRKYDWPELDED